MTPNASLTQFDNSLRPDQNLQSSKETAVEYASEVRSDEDAELLPGLTADLETKIIQTIQEFEIESYGTWRYIYRNFLEAESFWKDLQFGYFDYSSDVYRFPSYMDRGSSTEEASLNFQFVTNIYRAFGWTVISVLGQRVPSVVFLPNDYTNEDDVTSAQAAQDLVPVLERQNKLSILNMRAAYYLYTDGVCASYVRYILDGDRFGWRKEPIYGFEGKKLFGGSYLCPDCGHQQSEEVSGRQENPRSQSSSVAPPVRSSGSSAFAGMMPQTATDVLGGSPGGAAHPGVPSGEPKGAAVEPFLQPPMLEGSLPACESCGHSLDSETYQSAEDIDVPSVSGYKKVPKGRVVITIHGGLELRVPPWLKDASDFPFFGMCNEHHLSQLKTTYGARARNLTGGTSGAYDIWDRFARLMLTEPFGGAYYSLANQSLITLRQYWLRPAAFSRLDDADRDRLLAIFPDGAYVAYSDNGRLLAARTERLDDHIVFCQGMEGAEAAFTPAIGQSCISIQKRYNIVHNFIVEWLEYAAAGQGTFINSGLVQINALKKQRRAPGMLYPLALPPAIPIANAIYDSRPGAIASEVFTYGQQLIQLGQLVTGAVPTVAGGTEKSLKPTTYLSDREQALGKLYVPWQHLRHFWSRTLLNAVKEFARCEETDVKYSLQRDDGSVLDKTVHLDSLRGDFDAYPEVNEDFPRLLHQQQAMFLSMLQSSDPTVRQLLSDPRNLPYTKNLFGWPSIFVPGEDDVLKQKREINRLVGAQPVQQVNPQTGQPMMLPSVMPNLFADNHALQAQICRDWAVSDEGIRVQHDDPQGFQNVILHGQLHVQMGQHMAMQQQQMAQQMESAQEQSKIAQAQMNTKQVTERLKAQEQPPSARPGAQPAPSNVPSPQQGA